LETKTAFISNFIGIKVGRYGLILQGLFASNIIFNLHRNVHSIFISKRSTQNAAFDHIASDASLEPRAGCAVAPIFSTRRDDARITAAFHAFHIERNSFEVVSVFYLNFI